MARQQHPQEFWPGGVRLVISISMQFEAGGQALKNMTAHFHASIFQRT